MEEYLEAIVAKRKPRFLAIRELILKHHPHAKESMRYRMPTYESPSGWVALANQKQYISLYTCGPQHLEAFKRQCPDVKTGKGCINIRERDELPLRELASVIESAMNRSEHS